MVNSEKKSSSSISPSSPQLAIIFLTSPSMVAAWPFICSPRSAELCSISLRRSGLASNTTPLPKIGVMNGYASAWSRSSSAERKKNSLASAPDRKMTCLSTSWNQPTSPHSSRMRFIRPIGSVRNSSRWPCSSSPPETRGTMAVVICSLLTGARTARRIVVSRSHCAGIPSSPSASFWRSVLSANGASG